MIASFKHKGLSSFFTEGTKKGITPQHAPKLKRLLDRLDAAADIRDMQFPGSNLHLLEPRQEGIWSVKITGNWRITFRFEEGQAYDVDYVDYH